MKKTFFIMSVFFLTGLFGFSSCEKQEISPFMSSQNVRKTISSGVSGSCRDFIHHFYASTGWIYCWEANETLLQGEICGWYWRSYTDAPESEGVNCVGFSGSCLPDVDIRNSGTLPGREAGLPKGFRLNDESVKYVEKMMAKLAKAVRKGPGAVKKFYFNQGGMEFLGFQQEVENDLQNDIITIKEFNNKFLVVYYNATDPDDCPNYDSD